MKVSYLFITGCCFLSALLLGSCNKTNGDDKLNTPDKITSICDIKKMLILRNYYADTLIVDFKYNKWGNPTDVLLSVVSTGQPQFQFRYDSNNRVTDFIQRYIDPPPVIGYEGWTRFGWENGRIARDTFWGLGHTLDGKNPSPNSGNFFIATHTYDHKDRIIRSDIEYPKFPTVPPYYITYTYNSVGNLEREQTFKNGVLYSETVFPVYDNNISLLRTHTIWMHINKNFSINNYLNSESFNQYGLPVKLSSNPGKFGFLDNRLDIAISDIQYECK